MLLEKKLKKKAQRATQSTPTSMSSAGDTSTAGGTSTVHTQITQASTAATHDAGTHPPKSMPTRKKWVTPEEEDEEEEPSIPHGPTGPLYRIPDTYKLREDEKIHVILQANEHYELLKGLGLRGDNK